MAKQEKNFFRDLTRLFRSGPVVKRKIRALDTTVAKPDPTSSGTLLFQKSLSPSYASITSNAYNISERLMRYQDFQEMEQCLHGDTLIAIPGGFKTIKELADEYGTDKEFVVYSYDHNKKQIVPAFAKQARQTCVDHAWKVTFDNGTSIIGSHEHRLLKRDGHFCEIKDLQTGDAMMPFYRPVKDDEIIKRNKHDVIDLTFAKVLNAALGVAPGFGNLGQVSRALDVSVYHVENVLRDHGYNDWERLQMHIEMTLKEMTLHIVTL